MGFYSPRQLIGDAQRHGCTFLPLDVQNSSWDYTLEGKQKKTKISYFERQRKNRNQYKHNPGAAHAAAARAQANGWATAGSAPGSSAANSSASHEVEIFDIRVGFCSVYGLKEDHARALIEEREKNGPFKDLPDLVRRTRLSKAAMIRLAAADALSCFGYDAREAMWVIQGLSFDQQSLFFGSHSGLDEERQLNEIKVVPEEDGWQTVQREYQTKGFSIDKHPLGILRPRLQQSAVRYITAEGLKSLRNKSKIRVAGLISLLQKPPTAKGMAFASIEDETGLMNVVITPDIYAKYRLVIMGSPLLEVDGHLEINQGVYNIKAVEIRPLMKPVSDPKKLVSSPTYTKNI